VLTHAEIEQLIDKANRNDLKAIKSLYGHYYYSLNRELVLKYLKAAADIGDKDYQYKLGNEYDTRYDKNRLVDKNDNRAFELYRLAATNGYAHAQYELGIMFEEGRGGVERDDVEAAKWYKLAADQGHELASLELGFMYAAGRGVSENISEALKYFNVGKNIICKSTNSSHFNSELGKIYDFMSRISDNEDFKTNQTAINIAINIQRELGKYFHHRNYNTAMLWWGLAAKNGDAEAEFELGEKYSANRSSEGIKYDEAVKWYTLAANQGHIKAQYELGIMFEEGREGREGRGGVAKDYTEAVKWYKLAANQKNADAAYKLGVIYEHGRSQRDTRYRNSIIVHQDMREAVNWYKLAEANGNTAATRALRRLSVPND
jgi:TPR repeat protein